MSALLIADVLTTDCACAHIDLDCELVLRVMDLSLCLQTARN